MEDYTMILLPNWAFLLLAVVAACSLVEIGIKVAGEIRYQKRRWAIKKRLGAKLVRRGR